MLKKALFMKTLVLTCKQLKAGALTLGVASGSPGASFLIARLHTHSLWTRGQVGVRSRDMGSGTLKTSSGDTAVLVPLVKNPTQLHVPPDVSSPRKDTSPT